MTDLVQQQGSLIYVSTFSLFLKMGYKEHRTLKRVITENKEAFDDLGFLHLESSKPRKGSVGGRPEESYLLNLRHVLLLVSLSKNTASNADLKRYVVSCFIKSYFDASFIAVTKLISDIDVCDCDEDMFVYVAQEEQSGRYKIGISKNPPRRIKQLNTGNPEKLILVHAYLARDGAKDEKIAHALMAENRLLGEWFNSDSNVELLPSFYRGTIK